MQARIIVGIIIIVGLVGYLAFVGFEEGRSYYVTCDQVAASEGEFTNTNLKLAGVVVDGSITRDGDILTFELEYDGATYPVRYIGMDPVPDTFKDALEAVVDGRLLADGTRLTTPHDVISLFPSPWSSPCCSRISVITP